MLEINKDYPGKEFRALLEKDVKQYERAIHDYPNVASNYAGLAEASTILWCYGFYPRSALFSKSRAAAVKAVKIDPKLAIAHTILGLVKLSDWDWAAAEKEFQCAIELNSDKPQSYHWYALYLAAMGRHQQALDETRKALKLDPSPSFKVGYVSILYFARDFAQMVDYLNETITADPQFAPSYDWLGMAYIQLERFDEAIKVYRKAVRLSDGAAEVLAGLGHAYGVAGRIAEAQAVRDKLISFAKRWYIPPVQIAFVLVGLGEKDRAFELLERAYIERSWELIFIREEPWLDDLRSDPRFENLLKRMHFP
ncbi:MAG: tetratricopeptide repeat protein [Candidatus Marinimicrobia bacterium]|nr:tetratricopeptide repeat protein [Candidatus Neomarinimicrobiota bacterium]